ncbi:heterokaryon incompatibility protein-domain-containing protein [Stachybotrys elegans]|uniref:Heterokaryon incompatibility protein-domain-containing protein n=1 Tax=Stachybotrys elegans TaxID=80388 RepID=A0A8K0SYB8_9HYPO|nr:heterokaryon incompatibility protein-domain-containing protein [Stachybotrys elegans]
MAMASPEDTLPATSYVYRPLENTDIRVVLVQPLTNRAGTIECRITQAPLESLSFTALSYVWGDPKDTTEIILDGERFSVTVNLAVYLREIALGVASGQTTDSLGTYWWIDALCIDQGNVIERNAQVQRIGSIYSQADQVVIWLGKGGNHTDLGVAHIKELAKITKDAGGHEIFNDPAKRHYRGVFFHEGQDEKHANERAGTLELFRSPWWKRTWVLQELALAKRVLFLCGQDSFTFDQLYDAIILLQTDIVVDLPKVLESVFLSRDEERLFSYVFSCVNTRAIFEHNFADRYTSTRLQILLDRTKTSRATDPRDKIYGLLGMASDAHIDEIRPSYDLSIRDIYVDIAIWHLRQYDTLSILGQCFAGECSKLLTLPSWVPHWEPKEDHDRGPSVFHDRQFRDISSKLMRDAYSASGGRPLSSHPWSVDDMTGTLNLTGARVGSITFLSDVADLEYFSIPRENPFQVARDWLKLGDKLGERYEHTRESVDRAIRRTLVADIYDRNVIETSGIKYKQRGFWIMFPEDPPLWSGEAKWDYQDSMLIYMKTANKRRLAFSSQGWVGVVPSTAAVGDQIAVFVGGPVLYIVRQNDLQSPMTTEIISTSDSFSLVGEAYFHGFMDGKALEGRHLETITLR